MCCWFFTKMSNSPAHLASIRENERFLIKHYLLRSFLPFVAIAILHVFMCVFSFFVRYESLLSILYRVYCIPRQIKNVCTRELPL